MRLTMSRALAAAVASTAALVTTAAQAADVTYTFTVPAGGLPLNYSAYPAAITNPAIRLATFASVPFAEVVGFSYTGLSITTVGTPPNDVWGQDVSAGFIGRAEYADDVISVAPFPTSTTAGTNTASNSFDITGAGFYVPSNGQLPLITFSQFNGSATPEGTINAGTYTITIDDSSFEPPITAPSATPVVVGGSLTTSLGVDEVKFYSFTHTGGAFSVNTTGSNLIEPDGDTNDTELGLYDSAGALVASNDDIDFDNDNFLSEITLASLPAGNYYLAAGGYNTTFGGGFAATSTSDMVGTLQINGISVVPEPTTLAALAGLSATLIRRRRA